MIINFSSSGANNLTISFSSNGMGTTPPTVGDIVTLKNLFIYEAIPDGENMYIVSSSPYDYTRDAELTFTYSTEPMTINLQDCYIYDAFQNRYTNSITPTGAMCDVDNIDEDEVTWGQYTPTTYTLQIAPSGASDIKVYFNGVESSEWIYTTSVAGETVNWRASAVGYTSRSGTWVANGDDLIAFELVPYVTFRYAKDSTDTGFEITLTGTRNGTSIEVTRTDVASLDVDQNTYVTASYSRTGYQSDSNVYLMTDSDRSETFIPSPLSNTVTINSTPSNATINVSYIYGSVEQTETGTGSVTVTVDYGSELTATASLNGYATATSTLVIREDQTVSLTLTSKPTFTLVVDSPSNVSISLNYTVYGEASSESVNANTLSVYVDSGTTVTWNVSSDNYETNTGVSEQITQDTTRHISLTILPSFTLNVLPATAEATVNYTQKGTLRSFTGTVPIVVYVDPNTTVNWQAYATGYITQSGSNTIVRTNVTESVELEEEVEPTPTHTISLTSTPNDASITLTYVNNGTSQTATGTGSVQVTADEGTPYSWSVSKSGYVTKNGSGTVSGDITASIELSLDIVTYSLSFQVIPNTGSITLTYTYEGVENTVTYGDTILVAADEGSQYSWTASAAGYVTQSGSGIVNTNISRTIELERSYTLYNLTINSVPSTASISIRYTRRGSEYTANGNGSLTVSADEGSTYYYSVSQSGYLSNSGSNVLTDNTSFTVSLSANVLTYSGDTTIPANSSGSVYTITVLNPAGTGSWSVDYTGTAAWFTQVSRSSTVAGSLTINYSAATNATSSARNTSFVVSATDAQPVTVTITQAASSEVTVTVSPTQTVLSSTDTTTKSITWESTSTAAWTYSNNAPSWIHITSVTRAGDGKMIIIYYADANTGSSARTWTVTGTQSGRNYTAIVTQTSSTEEENTPAITLSKSTLNASGDTFTATVSSHQTITAWNVTVSPSSQVNSITYNGNVATVRVKANSSESLLYYTLTWFVQTTVPYTGTITLIQGQSLSIAGGPIWKEVGVAVEAPSNSAFVEYHINSGNTILYAAKAYPEPTTRATSVILNDVCENYLGNGITFTAGVQEMPDYYKQFKFVTNTGTETNFSFYNSWAYKEIPSHQILSDPISTTVDWRQWIPISWLSLGTDNLAVGNERYSPVAANSGSTLMLKASSFSVGSTLNVDCSARRGYGNGDYPLTYYIANECGEYVLYYCNAYGGWDALLVKGNTTKRDDIESFNYRKKAPRTDFSKTKYMNRITPTWNLHTDYFVNGEKMYHLIESPLVYLHILATDEIIPVIVTDTSVSYLNYSNNGKNPVSYEINVEESHLKFRK